jgi:hypothetical protein
MTTFDDALDAAGGRREPIPIQRRWQLLQQWREVYAAQLHAVTGKWTWKGYDWHVFSFRHAQAIDGLKASLTYASLPPPKRCIVCPHDERLPAVVIGGGSLPDFGDTGQDITVWPHNLAWTMAFTHETGWFGPYFSRREWIRAPAR